MAEESLVRLEVCMLEERLLDEQNVTIHCPTFTICIVYLYDLNLYSSRPQALMLPVHSLITA